jgi:hypothetical protein
VVARKRAYTQQLIKTNYPLSATIGYTLVIVLASAKAVSLCNFPNAEAPTAHIWL